MKASGEFEVDLQPLSSYYQGSDGIRLGCLSIDKKFYGDLDAYSKGEMLSAITQVKGSAGYVAIEQVTGVLGGMTGSFVLQHYGIMNQGTQRLILEVVPDSGTGELEGLTGTMSILVEGDASQKAPHRYEFDYQLA